MSHPHPATTRIVPPDSRAPLHAFGDEILFHLTGEETGGRCAMFTITVPPGHGPPLHYHRDEDEWFLVLEGRAEFFREGQWHEAPTGTAVFTPRGVWHSFRNPGTTTLKLLTQTSPAGFETFFARCAAEFARPEPPDPARVAQIGAEHGIFFAE